MSEPLAWQLFIQSVFLTSLQPSASQFSGWHAGNIVLYTVLITCYCMAINGSCTSVLSIYRDIGSKVASHVPWGNLPDLDCSNLLSLMPKRKRDCKTFADALEDLNLRIASLSKEITNKKRRQRYQENQAKPNAMSTFMKTVLVLLYVFAGYNVSLASSYWVN